MTSRNPFELTEQVSIHAQLRFWQDFMVKIHEGIAEQFQNADLMERVGQRLDGWQALSKVQQNRELDYEEAEQLLSYTLNEEFTLEFLDLAASREQADDLNNLSWNLLLEIFGITIQKIHHAEHVLNPSSEYTLDSFTNEVNEENIQKSFSAVLEQHASPNTLVDWVERRIDTLTKAYPWDSSHPMGPPILAI